MKFTKILLFIFCLSACDSDRPGPGDLPPGGACDLQPQFQPRTSIKPALSIHNQTGNVKICSEDQDLELTDNVTDFFSNPCDCEDTRAPSFNASCVNDCLGLPRGSEALENCSNDCDSEFPEGVFDFTETRRSTIIPPDDELHDSLTGCNRFIHYAWPDCSLIAQASTIVRQDMEPEKNGGPGFNVSSPSTDNDHDMFTDTCPANIEDTSGINMALLPGFIPFELRSIGSWANEGERSNGTDKNEHEGKLDNNPDITVGPPIDDDNAVDGSIHPEVQACRYFIGEWTINDPEINNLENIGGDPSDDHTFTTSTLPKKLDRWTVAGDWMTDDNHEGHTEIHEARISAITRSTQQLGLLLNENFETPPTPSDPLKTINYSLVSGFFGRDTPQAELLELFIPAPEVPSDANIPFKRGLSCDILRETDVVVPIFDTSSATATNTYGSNTNEELFSCGTNGSFENNSLARALPMIIRDPTTGTPTGGFCAVTVDKLSLSSVDGSHDFSCDYTCPLVPDGPDENIRDDVHFFGKNDTEADRELAETDCERLAATFVVRAEWFDPSDTWKCDCDCEDPSFTGDSFSVPIVGCTTTAGLDPTSSADRLTACSEICHGRVCGLDESCEIGFCAAPTNGDSAVRLSQGSCDTSQFGLDLQVAEIGDYHITLDSSQSKVVFKVGETGLEREVQVSGELRVNIQDDMIDITSLSGEGSDFRLLLEHFTQNQGFLIERMMGYMTSPTDFVIPAEMGRFTVFSEVESLLHPFGVHHFITTTNPVDLEGHIEITGTTFRIEFEAPLFGDGPGESNLELEAEWIGTIDNKPPLADASRTPTTVECTSPDLTPVTLDGTASTDPDAESLSHYQWFTADTNGDDLDGLGNLAIQSTELPLGDNELLLHVYDQDLSSGQVALAVKVQDTTQIGRAHV